MGSGSAMRLYEKIPVAFSGLSDGTVLILLPVIGILVAISSTRKYGGSGLILVSYLFVASIWVSSIVTVYYFWGGKLVLGGWGERVLLAGILLSGVGSIFLSIVIDFQNHLWANLTNVIGFALLFFAARSAGAHAIASARTKSHRIDD